MGLVKNDPFPGTDYNKWQTWEKVTMPGGQVFYVIPGYPGYVLDPVASNASGRKVFRANPQAQITEQQQAKDAAEKERQQAAQARSPAGQLIPIVGTVGGTIGSAYAIDRLTSSSAEKTAETIGKIDAANKVGQGITQGQAAAQGATAPATTPTPAAAPAAATTQGQAAAQGLTGAAPAAPSVTAVGTGPTPGSTMMSDGSIVNANGTVIAPDGVTVNPQTGTAVNPDGSAVAPSNTGAYVQGALGVLQVVGGIRQFQQGDKFGGGLNVVAGGANVAQASGANLGANVVPGLNIATGLYSGYKTAEYTGGAPDGSGRDAMSAGQGALAGASIGAGVGSFVPVVGTAIGAGVGALVGGAAGYLGSAFGSGKDAKQMARDRVRKYLVDQKVVDKSDYTLKFGDGSTFDLGKDGGARLTNDKGEERQYSDVDLNDPRTNKTIAYVSPLAAIITGGSKKLANNFAGSYTNAVLAGGGDEAAIKARIRELYTKHNITQADAMKIVDGLKDVDPQTKAIYKSSLNEVFAGAPTVTTTPTTKPASAPAPLQPGQTAGSTAGFANTPAAPAVAPKLAPLQPGQTAASTAQFATGAPATPAQAAAAGMMRTTTRSPGIGLDGRRIVY
jgi:hypothetical protein